MSEVRYPNKLWADVNVILEQHECRNTHTHPNIIHRQLVLSQNVRPSLTATTRYSTTWKSKAQTQLGVANVGRSAVRYTSTPQQPDIDATAVESVTLCLHHTILV